MGAILEQRDGYGWVLTGANVSSDTNGIYYQGFNAASDITKTIYVDAYAGAPVFFSKTFRIYGAENDTFELTTTGLINDDFSGTEFTVSATGYADVVIEGYVISDVTVTIATASSGTEKLYPMYEAGY